MGSLASRKKEEEPPQAALDLPAAIQKTKEAISVLEKKQAHLEKRCAAYTEEARTRIKNKDNEGAKHEIRSKKMLEAQLLQLVNTRLTLEQRINDLESQQTQQLALQAISVGIDAHKNATQSLNISATEKLFEDMQDQQARQQEVNQIFNLNIPMVDDDELTAELAQMEEEDLVKRMDDISVPTAEIPSSPQAVPAAATSVAAKAPASPQQQRTLDVDDEQLNRLKAELAL